MTNKLSQIRNATQEDNMKKTIKINPPEELRLKITMPDGKEVLEIKGDCSYAGKRLDLEYSFFISRDGQKPILLSYLKTGENNWTEI